MNGKIYFTNLIYYEMLILFIITKNVLCVAQPSNVIESTTYSIWIDSISQRDASGNRTVTINVKNQIIKKNFQIAFQSKMKTPETLELTYNNKL